ncbi:MAG: transposase [Saprospiraceae bacterium]|nr:transposase [Saprospiraceae bacterium]
MSLRSIIAPYKEDYYLLRSIPGFGRLVVSAILSELGDIRRFQRIRTVQLHRSSTGAAFEWWYRKPWVLHRDAGVCCVRTSSRRPG